jgi:hypothetical protein
VLLMVAEEVTVELVSEVLVAVLDYHP